jgi:hypothetical protein
MARASGNRTMRICASFLALLALAACGGTTQAGPPAGEADAATHPDAAKHDSGPATHDAGTIDAATTCGGSISFDLAVNASGLVYYGGGQPPWPAQATCPGWLTIDHAGQALILERGNCDHSCPAFQPQNAAAQSLTWDGTYYPVTEPGGSQGPCEVSACAPAGNYVATFCIAAALGDGDASRQEAPPTCKTVNFVWPPTGVSQVISETITPAPDGG